MPNEYLLAERNQVYQLCKQALPDPSDTTLFIKLMSEASAKHMEWIESLEYVVEHRKSPS